MLGRYRGKRKDASTPALVGSLRDSGWSLAVAMAVCIVSALGLVLVMLWLGPETRGRALT
jgi:hypothetical protein